MPGNYDTQDNEWTTADPVGVGTNEDTADDLNQEKFFSHGTMK